MFSKKTRNYGIAMQRLVLQRLCGLCWQARFFDCALRSVEKYSEKAECDHLNSEAVKNSTGRDFG
jgi:hypothetical protein